MKSIKKNHRTRATPVRPHTTNEKAIDPGRLGCPECAFNENSDGIFPYQQEIIRQLRQFNADGHLIVFDPLSKVTLSGMAIQSVVANGPLVQISLHPDWLKQTELDEGYLYRRTAISPYWASEVGCPGHEPELTALVAQLQKLNADGLLAVWDSFTGLLLSGELISSVSANGDDIQITWAKDRSLDHDVENDAEEETAED